MTTQLAAVLLAGCGVPTQEAPPLDVWFGGCADVTAGPTCHVTAPGSITLWVPVVGAAVQFENAGAAGPTVARTRIDGGERITLTVTPSNRALVINASEGDFQLAIASPEDDDPHSKRAREHLRSGEFADAMQSLRAARSAYRRAGRSLAATRESAALTYFLIQRERAFARAARELDDAQDAGIASADARYHLAYYRGLIAFNSGDPRRALAHLGTAETLTRRMGWESRRLHVEQILAVQLQALGRRAEAHELLAQWTDPRLQSMSQCDRAMLINNRSWAALLQREAGENAPDPTFELLRARTLADEHCPVHEHTNVRVNLALAALQAGNDDDAAGHLRDARQLSPDPEPRQQHWMLTIDARLQRRRGATAAALVLHDQLEQLGAQHHAVDAQWRAHTGRARTLAAAGQTNAALAQYALAQALVRDQVLRIPLTEGRESFLAQQSMVWREHVALLLMQQRETEAHIVVRRARQDDLRGLQFDQQLLAMDSAALAAWRSAIGAYHAQREALSATLAQLNVAPTDQLAALHATRAEQARRLTELLDAAHALTVVSPNRSETSDKDETTSRGAGVDVQPLTPSLPSGVMALAIVRLADSWAIFSQLGATLNVHQTRCDTAQPVADCLLAALWPFAPDVRTLQVYTGDDDIEWAAARVDDGLLLDHVPIRYVFDLPDNRTAARGRRALVLADPDGSLAGARREATAINALLQETDWTLRHTDTETLTPAELGSFIGQVDLFHFAGHARTAGALGWDSALRLANGQQLSVGDILALDRVPGFVTLSGCETSAAGSNAVAGMGLAQAFLARGSRLVIATTRPVRDDAARTLMTDYYRAWHRGVSPAAALQRAQQRARDRGDDWSAFRLFTRDAGS